MLDRIAEDITKVLATKPFSGSLKFDCGKDGVIVMADGRATTMDQATDCTLTISTENLVSLLKGKLNPMMALATGKLKLSGNPAVAISLAKLLG